MCPTGAVTRLVTLVTLAHHDAAQPPQLTFTAFPAAACCSSCSPSPRRHTLAHGACGMSHL
eukprot:8806271-Lingulodinium_polyedra.AAC.1